MKWLLQAATRERVFWSVIGVAVLVKVVIALLLPVTGDEAYFIQYARHVDWGGFYDHPPMVGWLIWLMERVSSHPLVIRLPAIALGLVLALGTWALLREVDEQRARLVGLLLLLTPIYLVAVLMASDTGLIIFGFLSGLAYQRAVVTGRGGLFLLAGVLLGLAFMSKYFAAVLGLAYLVHFLVLARHHWRGFLLLLLGVAPFIVWNLAWNYLHCWDHVMFNVFNRHGGGGFSLVTTLYYLLTIVYLLALPLWYLVRHRGEVYAGVRRQRLEPVLFLAGVPLVLWLLASPWVRVGVHWLLLFIPFVYFAYVFLPRSALERSLRFMGWFAVAHVVLVVGLLLIPAHWFEDSDSHFDVVFHMHPDEVAEALEEYEADFHATSSYSRSSILDYYSDRDWSVYGGGGRHARQDDTLTDWRERDGQSMLYLRNRPTIDPEEDGITTYFERFTMERVTVRGVTFEIVIAEDFDYAAYREGVLRAVRERFYDFPDWLPVGGCPFTERYFDDGP